MGVKSIPLHRAFVRVMREMSVGSSPWAPFPFGLGNALLWGPSCAMHVLRALLASTHHVPVTCPTSFQVGSQKCLRTLSIVPWVGSTGVEFSAQNWPTDGKSTAISSRHHHGACPGGGGLAWLVTAVSLLCVWDWSSLESTVSGWGCPLHSRTGSPDTTSIKGMAAGPCDSKKEQFRGILRLSLILALTLHYWASWDLAELAAK